MQNSDGSQLKIVKWRCCNTTIIISSMWNV